MTAARMRKLASAQLAAADDIFGARRSDAAHVPARLRGPWLRQHYPANVDDLGYIQPPARPGRRWKQYGWLRWPRREHRHLSDPFVRCRPFARSRHRTLIRHGRAWW